MSTLQLDGCAVVEGAAGSNGCSKGAKRRLQFSPQTLERVLHAAFFILGMGLMAPLTAILQTMDYLNIFFAQYYPSRTLYTAYNTCNLMALVVLFKWGDRLWPNKRARMITGYSLYTIILMALPLMDFIIIDHVHGKHLDTHKAMELAFTVWAVGSCVAGFSDAFISTVAYSQAASIGQRYTHAFVGGRATSGLVMAALRCLSKGALRQNLAGLRQSTSIYVMIAALIVLTSVIIAGILLPRLGPQIEAMHKPTGTTMTVTDPTHHSSKCTACRINAQQLQQLHSLAPKGSLALQTAKSGRSGLPIPPAAPLDSSRISTWGSFSPLLTEKSGVLAPATSVDQTHQHKSRFSSQCGTWGGKLAAQSSYDVQELQHKQGLAQVLDAALPAAAEGSADSVTSHVSSSSSALIPHSKQQYCIAEEGMDGGSSSSQPSSPPCCSELAIMTSPCRLQNSIIAEAASEGSSQPSTPPSAACIDADVVVLTGKHSVEFGAKGPNGEDLIVARDSPTAKDQHMVVYLQNLTTAAHSVASELGEAAELRCTCGHAKADVSRDLDSSSSESSDSLTSSIGDSWWALLKIVWPFCLAVQPAPMTTATILPLNLSSQVANWPVATAARWHVQIMMVTVQIGFFLGSAVLPIKTPRRPRVTLLIMACLIFLFPPCFAAALMMHARPYAFLALALAMHTYSGYMTSTVFCVASQGFASKDVVRVQQLLVLSMGMSYVVGSCVSWIWVFIGRP